VFNSAAEGTFWRESRFIGFCAICDKLNIITNTDAVLHRMNLADADVVGRLSSRYVAPSAVAANAARAAMLSGGGEAAVEEALGSTLQILGTGLAVSDTDASDFDPALVNCGSDPARLG
jgi:hypothetical protein